MYKYLFASIIGVVTGFIAGFQGIAGSFYILTALLLTGIAKNQREAAGTTLLTIVFPLSIGAVYEYYSTGDVNVPIALTIMIFYILSAYFGAEFNYLIEEKYILYSISFMMIIASFYYLYKGKNTKLTNKKGYIFT